MCLHVYSHPSILVAVETVQTELHTISSLLCSSASVLKNVKAELEDSGWTLRINLDLSNTCLRFKNIRISQPLNRTQSRKQTLKFDVILNCNYVLPLSLQFAENWFHWFWLYLPSAAAKSRSIWLRSLEAEWRTQKPTAAPWNTDRQQL